MRGESVVIAEVAHCLGCGLAELGTAVTDIDAPEPGPAIDQLSPPPVLDPDPGAAGDDRRPVFQMIGDRGCGMDQALPIHFFE
jgi:hypothetical protein